MISIYACLELLLYTMIKRSNICRKLKQTRRFPVRLMLFCKQQKSKFVYRGEQGCYQILQSPILNISNLTCVGKTECWNRKKMLRERERESERE